MRRCALLCLCLCLCLLLAAAALARDEVADDPVPRAEVREALRAGPIEGPFDDSWSDLFVSDAPPPQAVLDASRGRRWLVRVEPETGTSPRLLQAGGHLVRFAGSKRPSVTAVDDEGRVREHVLLHDRHPMRAALEEAGVDLSPWLQPLGHGEHVPPVLVDLPDGGWLFYGPGRSARPTRGLAPPMDHVGGTASGGAASWSPSALQKAGAALGAAPVTIMAASEATGCLDLSLVPARLGRLDLSALPGVRESTFARRTLRFEEGSATVPFEAVDLRPLGGDGGTTVHGPTAGTMVLGRGSAPVKWQGELDSARVAPLVAALGSGLRCTGEVEERPNPRQTQGRIGYQPDGQTGMDFSWLPERRRWVLSHLATFRYWEFEDVGLLQALEQTWAVTATGGAEAWAAVQAKCPPPLDDARVMGLAMDYSWSGLSGRVTDLWEWERRDGEWAWQKQRTRGFRGDDVRTTSGFVDAAVVDALLAAAGQGVSCQTEGFRVTTHTDDYPKWKLTLTLADGRALSLSSESNTRNWQPWLVQVGDYSGVQEGGQVGVALRALMDAVEASAGR